ncbi:hypothetical protein ASE75_09340 [Sphingomonas sp. Leaf17]|uniref:hypothetical protein n=1 Tax=Sphingomonas sp. Leaf17 TaxID=1735683 RepID=UPI0007022C35|nr:hypothetical protein [Sphingomonas sp. Leaf17]KQM64194.1 hypothetical protein ASE75_09340 [Sphingomonas sp. Leaf17]
MTIQRAAAIVQRVGPCRILIDADQHGDLARELALMGCVTGAGAGARPALGRAVAVIALPDKVTPVTLGARLAPIEKAGAGTLVLLATGQARAPVEAALFARGWRRHPGGMTTGEYAPRDQPALAPLTFYDRTHGGAGLRGVDDPLRRGDGAADAHLALLALAAERIRHGDRVLVCGDGQAADADVLMTQSRCHSVEVLARGGLDALAPHSFDFVLALDGDVTGLDWAAQLAVFAALLRPDGRIMTGWSQDGPAAPRDWAALVDALATRFLVEARFVLAAPGNPTPTAPRVIYGVSTEGDHASGWLIALASCNPLAAAGREDDGAVPFAHPAFPLPAGDAPPVVDFGAAYDNPWLYRTMVQMGERLTDDVLLARLAEVVVSDSDPASADRGAALAVLGYRVIELRMTGALAGLMPLIDAYCAQAATAPHVVRWQISLAFLAGRLRELAGDPAAALDWYARAAAGDYAAFSPILATKVVAACFHAARLHLALGDVAAAADRFRRGVAVALAAAAAPHAAQMGDPDRPTPFYLTELAEVMDMGSQCANALAHLPLWERDPGLFWRQVDIRRFGLASWARDLEQENRRLAGG